jgi:NTE family protein
MRLELRGLTMKAAALALSLIQIAKCTSFNYTQADGPVPLASVPTMNSRPQVALVLGSGGPRGYAHIGVMKVLEQTGIEYDLVVGSSVGSLIGVFWASGYAASKIDDLSRQGGPLTVFDFPYLRIEGGSMDKGFKTL